MSPENVGQASACGTTSVVPAPAGASVHGRGRTEVRQQAKACPTLRTTLRLFGGILLAALSLAQVSSELITPDIRRVGSRLACLCGSCKNSVGDCAMLACHYSKPAREKIRDMQAKGMSDDAITAEFVKQEGKHALVVPPAEGFSGLAWWMPPAVVGLGLAFIYWWIRRMRSPAAVAAIPEVDPAVLDRYRDSIEKDLAKLE